MYNFTLARGPRARARWSNYFGISIGWAAGAFEG